MFDLGCFLHKRKRRACSALRFRGLLLAEVSFKKTLECFSAVSYTHLTEEQLSDNFQTLIEAIVKARPNTLKGQYLRSVTIAPTMGPGVKINPAKLV